MSALKTLLQFEELINAVGHSEPSPLSDEKWSHIFEAGDWLLRQLNLEEMRTYKEIGKLQRQRNLMAHEFDRKIEGKISAILETQN